MYDIKSNDYFTHVRTDIIGALRGNKFDKVLELGAGGCDTLLYLKQQGIAGEVTGVELFDIPDSNQKHPAIDQLHISGIENIPILPLKQNYYDLVICGDVLEHVFDPWQVLLNVKALMKDDAILVCSIPNFRDFQTMKKIFLQGDFEYNPEGGILDKTHMRFFCKKNIINLFNKSGYKIEKIEPSFKYAPSQKTRKWISQLSLGLLEEFMTFQYLVTVHPRL